MRLVEIKLYGIVLIITGILYGSIFYPVDTKATILSGIDEPTGNAYEDVYIVEEENATITSGSNQTTNTNTTQVPL